jgi:hypothetical protein
MTDLKVKDFKSNEVAGPQRCSKSNTLITDQAAHILGSGGLELKTFHQSCYHRMLTNFKKPSIVFKVEDRAERAQFIVLYWRHLSNKYAI